MDGTEGYVFVITTSKDENCVGLTVDIESFLKLLNTNKSNIKYIRPIKNYSIILIKFIRLFKSLKMNRYDHNFWWIISENSKLFTANIIESIIEGKEVKIISNNKKNTIKEKTKKTNRRIPFMCKKKLKKN